MAKKPHEEVPASSTQVEDFQNQLAEKDALIKQLQDAATEQAANSKFLQEQLDGALAQANQAVADKAAADEQMTALQGQIDDLTVLLDAEKEKVARQIDELADLNTQLGDAKDGLDRQIKRVHALKDDIEEMEARGKSGIAKEQHVFLTDILQRLNTDGQVALGVRDKPHLVALVGEEAEEAE